MKLFRRIFSQTLGLVAGIIIGLALVGCGLAMFPGDKGDTAPAQLNPVNAQTNISPERNTPVVRAAQKVGPAVVGINNKGYARDPFNRKVMVERGTGSGVIYDKSGYIVTNNHVVEGAEELTISLSDGRSFTGKVLGADPVTDLAVVKIDNATDLPVAEFGDSDNLVVGEPAIAIGNPLGLEFRGSVTAGVISAIDRALDIEEQRFQLLQTDAAINPGNSGGALVNADGQVIGINSIKIRLTGVEGMGFAIPINAVKPIIKDLAEKGKVVRPYLGIALMDKQSSAYYFGILFERGLLVARVYDNSPAYKSGIRQGDVILNINGIPVSKVLDLRSILNNLPVGQKVDLVISRDNKNITVSVLLEEQPRE